MYEEKANVHVSITNSKGKTSNIVGLAEDEKDSLAVIDGSGTATIPEEDAVPGQMHYLVVKNVDEGDSEISLLITVDRTVITLSDGVPMELTFNGFNDMSKFLVFGLPEG